MKCTNRVLALVLAFIMTLGLVACGGGTNPAIDPTVPTIETTEPAVETTAPTIETTEPAVETTEPDDFIIGPCTDFSILGSEESISLMISPSSTARFYSFIDFIEMEPRYEEADGLYACSGEPFTIYTTIEGGACITSYTIYTYSENWDDTFEARYEDAEELKTFDCSDSEEMNIPYMFGDKVVTKFDFTVEKPGYPPKTYTMLNIALGG